MSLHQLLFLPSAEHHVHWQRTVAPAADELADARRRAALQQVVAQLDAVCATRLRRHRRSDAVGADLQAWASTGTGAPHERAAPAPGEDGAAKKDGASDDKLGQGGVGCHPASKPGSAGTAPKTATTNKSAAFVSEGEPGGG